MPSGYRSRAAKVQDGDTLTTSGGTILRLEGVDAPELPSPAAERTKKQLERLVLGKKITWRKVAIDPYGRRIARVRQGGRNINALMRGRRRR